ncbi:hypothetical protein CYLTODRAFT_447233 [Cylindrobasidium torrendii FP15055 ss-10]|uniref:Cryptic loci regulator 2 N-terminal domain-containing protein n=1 Tax=Cylindrobasidium torrendii FP15055 ss-10 TaxID=1314674 RepID=A0A0D7AX14_9AGAR|nr:hypothetical protein CYLTODRAFT_447233 [Cylindrobasidium torrendii FP15055 ss-10]
MPLPKELKRNYHPPANPIYIEPPTYSDGDSARWPTQLSEGSRVNPYKGIRLETWEHIPVNTSLSVAWQSMIGQTWADRLQLKGNRRSYMLSQWPKGYRLFVHKKFRDDGTTREDPYLFGGSGRYSSAHEFYAHFVALKLGTLKNCPCQCCTSTTSQKLINKGFAEVSVVRRAGTGLHKLHETHKPYEHPNAGSSVTLPPSSPPPVHFQPGQLVWICLGRSVLGQNPGETYWPALVDEHCAPEIAKRSTHSFATGSNSYRVSLLKYPGKAKAKVDVSKIIPHNSSYAAGLNPIPGSAFEKACQEVSRIELEGSL